MVTRERFELPTPTFVASYSNPTELTSLVSSFWVQRYNRQMKPFFVAEKKFFFSNKGIIRTELCPNSTISDVTYR